MVSNKQKPWYDTKPRAGGEKEFDYQYLKSMTPFLLSLVISCIGP